MSPAKERNNELIESDLKSMKESFIMRVGVALILQQSVYGDDVIGGSGPYVNVFSEVGNATVDPDPPSGLATVNVGGTAGPVDVGLWELEASGGVSATLLGIPLTESGASVSLDGDSLNFGISAVDPSIVGALGGIANIATVWNAKLTLDSPAIALQPMTTYDISFDVNGSDGLFDGFANIFPEFEFTFMDGGGNPIQSPGGVDTVSLLGLGIVGGAGSQSVNLQYTTGPSVGSGPATLMWAGSALITPDALSALGTDNYAEVSNLTLAATPVPEPAVTFLSSVGALLLLLRRDRCVAG